MDLEDIFHSWAKDTGAKIKGWGGEIKTQVSQVVCLDPKKYHIFNNVLVPIDGTTSQIDHVIVSQYGIFVVETKDKSGWIFGNEQESFWTQTFPGNSFKFQNPLRQNYKHITSLSRLLEVNQSAFYSIIVFWGAEFKKPMPDNVVKNPIDYNNYIKSKKDIILTPDQVDAAKRCLSDLKINTSVADHRHHVEMLKQRYKCPECSGALSEKKVKSGLNAGRTLLGCSNYPKCRYHKYL